MAGNARRIEQRERRQLGSGIQLDQCDLPLLFHALARLCRRGLGLDPRRRPGLDLLLHDLYRLGALLADEPRLVDLAEPSGQLHQPTEERQRRGADPVHNPDPGQVAEQRHAPHQQDEQQQRGAGAAEGRRQLRFDELAEDAAGALGQEAAQVLRVQPHEPAARRQGHDETGPAERDQVEVETVVLPALAQEHPAAPADHDRQQVGRVPEEGEQQARQVGAHGAAKVRGLVTQAHVGPARILRRKGQQAEQQEGRHGRDEQQYALPHPTGGVLAASGAAGGDAVGLRLGHEAISKTLRHYTVTKHSWSNFEDAPHPPCWDSMSRP